MLPKERLLEAFETSAFKSMAELGRKAGVNPVTMRSYFHGHANPPLEVCQHLEPLLGYSARWLFEGVGPKKVSKEPNRLSSSKSFMVPIIDDVTAGSLVAPSSQIPDKDWKTITVSGLPTSEFFALKVVGNSMDRISPEGSIIIVDRNDRNLISGKPYVCMLRDETTYKLWYDDDPQQLHPFSTDPTHRAKAITRKREFAVIGRVRKTILDL